MLRLRAGAHIAIVGGGPAGSAFALFALHYARATRLPLSVTIFEPRDFSRPGPWGCNMCAGLIPVRFLTPLQELGIEIPPAVIRNTIDRYVLHTAAGSIALEQPDPDGGVISVYRGNGPREGPEWPEPISLDRFLLERAQMAGARVLPERVVAITVGKRPRVHTRHHDHPADLVVLAAGVNGHPIRFYGLRYRSPSRRQMAQTEFYLGEEEVRARLGNCVHIVLPQVPGFLFGTLVPKGPCVSVSLLGQTLPRGSLQRFLELREVRHLLPPDIPRACGCRPHIAVSPARPLYADRFVAIGDAGITRLYKNGIGTAVFMARRAAYTAVCMGIDKGTFRRYYGPACQLLWWDNQLGRALFNFTPLFQFSDWFTRPHLLAILEEQSLPLERRRYSRLLWGMFTGTYPYRALVRMAIHPRLHTQIFRAFLRERSFVSYRKTQ